jgi:DNA-binding beta-propeller fold protein YncE
MVILTSTVSNNSIFTFNKAYATLSVPSGVAVDSSGNVFVSDSGNDRIQKFTNTGTFIRKWST